MKATKEEWCSEKGMSLIKFEQQLELAHQKLNKVRDQRTHPGLDDKQLTSWNAMTIKGLAEAGLALQNTNYIDEAKKTANWLVDHQLDRKSTRLNSSHVRISYAVFCLKK